MNNSITRFKIAIFNSFPFVAKYIAYNRFRRDAWVREKSLLIPKDSFVLDIGAGSCPYRNLFDHCQYKAQDFTQLKSEQIQHEAGYGQIDYVCDILNIPIQDKLVDVVLCTEVIEHVPYPIDVIKEVSRILKPGGKLLITAPLQSGLHQEPYHFYGGFTKFWYLKILEENNFENIEITPNGSLYTTIISNLFTLIKECLEDIANSKFKYKIFSIFLLLIIFPFGLISIFPLFFAEFFYKRFGFTAGYHVSANKII